MKRYIELLLIVICGVSFTSCEKELKPYDDPTCRLNFLYNGGMDSTDDLGKYDDSDYTASSYSFIYDGDNKEQDTVWFQVGVSGFLYDYPRPITLKQIAVPDTVDNAEPSVHYVPFSDPTLSSYYTVPANAAGLYIPVVLLRDTSLNRKDVVLRFGFETNDYFSMGFPKMSYRTLYVTARLSKPSQWYSGFGDWGPVKHQLMIEWTGKKWDDECFIDELYSNSDMYYQTYLVEWFANKLKEENDKRIAAGEEPYKEADGTPVSFD